MLYFPPFEQNEPSDTSEVLRLAGGGQFNQTVWRINASGDHTGLEAQLLTLHEWSHNELNNVSIYGALLTAFAHLARHAKSDRARHRDTLHALAERSRQAHEVYATWYSTDMFLLRAGLADLLALYPPDYRAYFTSGANLVEGIASPFLQQQAFLCAVRICFSGAEFASHGRDLAAFRPEQVPAHLYPSDVLDSLTKVVPAGFFAEQLDAFLRTEHPPGVAYAIETACAVQRRDADFFGPIPAEQADAATMELHRWFHQKLSALLAAQGVPCAPYGSHLEFIADLIVQLETLCDATALTHPLVFNAQPHDNAANLLLHMENEVLYVRPDPLPCALWPITEVPRENWPRLATGEPPHFFFCVRHAAQLLAQHRFPEDQRIRVQEMIEPLVFLRRRGRRDGQVECETFLFQSPDELAEFRRATPDVPAFSSIAMSVLGDSSWCERWLPVVTETITGTILFDRSVFHTIKDGWQPYVSVRYAKGVLQTVGTDYVFLTFLVESADGSHSLYLCPCSELFVRATVAFIERKFSPTRFVRDERFMNELSWLLPPVVSHLVAEEQFFSFNQIRYL